MLRLLSSAEPELLAPHLTDLLPSLCALLQNTSGPSKLAAERTLARLLKVSGAPALQRLSLLPGLPAPADASMLQAEEGPDTAHAVLASGKAGSLVRTFLTDPYLRRLGRLSPEAEDFELLAAA